MDKTENANSGKIVQSLPTAFSIRYLWHLSGRLLPLFSLLFITIIYSHRLSLDEYSLFQSVWMYANVISVIIGYGVTTIIFSSDTYTIISFIKRNRKEIFTSYSVLSLAACVIFYIVSDHFSVALKLLVILFIFLQFVNTILETWIIRNEKQSQYLLINLAYAIFFFLWHLYIIFQPAFQLNMLIVGVIILSALKMMLLFTIKPATTGTDHITTATEKELKRHWAYAGINDIFGILSKWADKLILIYLLTPGEFAIFFNGTIDIPFVAMFISITGSYMMMRMASDKKNSELTSHLFRENFLMISSFSFPLFFFLFFFRNEFFLIFFGEKYLPAVPIFAVSVFILLLRVNHFGGILQIHSRSDWVTIGSLIDLIISSVLVFILYHFFGMQGAACAIVISTLVQLTYYLAKSSQLLGKSIAELVPLRALLARLALSGAFMFITRMMLPSVSATISLIIGALVMVAVIVASGWKYFRQMTQPS